MDWLKDHQQAQLGNFADAPQFGELVVLAVKGTAAQDALRAASATNLAGKPVIDATNPIADTPPVNWRIEVFHESRRILNGTPTARI
jgi:8-hydroxy-5-deazaflavin:NADPH oxidoreductase